MNTARCRFRHAEFSLFLFALLAVPVAPAAHADETAPPRFVMSVGLDTRGSESLVARDAQTAIGLLRSGSHRNVQPYDVATNLCVAHTLRGDLASANAHCEQAVRIARSEQNEFAALRQYSMDTAVALSNRGVLRALNGQLAEARRDLERAAALARRDGGIAQNLRRLEQLERESAQTPTTAAGADVS